MDRLILFRHGKAEPDSASGDDFDRRLAPGGHRESAETAARLAEIGFLPDLALVSTAARARDPWTAAQPHFPAAAVSFERDLYEADSNGVRQVAARAGSLLRTVMVIGHNPSLQELAVRLLVEGSAPSSLIVRTRRQFPTAAAAAFLFDDNGRAAFDGLFLPERGD